jgi:selenide,water dikinase
MKRLVLVGAGHSHLEVLRRFARTPVSAEIVLVSPESAFLYSGMLPGCIAGHYSLSEISVPLAPLCGSAGIRIVRGNAIGLNPGRREISCDDGTLIGYDTLSLDIGSAADTRTPGVHEHAISVKPLPAFVADWQRMLDAVRGSGKACHIAIVGGGAGGVELALAMQYALRLSSRMKLTVVTDAARILAPHPPRVTHTFERIFGERRIGLETNHKVARVAAGLVERDGAPSIAADYIVWAAGAAAPAWLAASGLKTDSGGFVLVDEHLQSLSHAGIFAAGDVATMAAHVRPKSGVYAVRQGPPLAHNLQRALSGKSLVRYTPQRLALALISTGNRCAVASYAGLSAEGAWVWRWKDWVDRRFVARYESVR